MSVVTNQPIQVSYFVADITTALLTYNRLRWYRSASGEAGLYEAVSGAAAAPATFVCPSPEPHSLNGKTLSFTVDGTQTFNVTFATADPADSTSIANEINVATGAALVASAVGGRLILTSATQGTGSSVAILSGDANPFLGLSEGDGALGLDADTVLVDGTHEYFFTDQNSDPDYWYRVEFLNAGNSSTSGLGVPFPANAADAVPVSQTIVGFVRLTDLSGRALAGRKITFYNAGMPNLVSSVQGQTITTWGVQRQFAQLETDRNGYAELRLLRGIIVDLNIEGGVTRRIQIPTAGDSFQFLEPSLQVSDEYGIQDPDIDSAIRTT
jgi:hypothetical protein